MMFSVIEDDWNSISLLSSNGSSSINVPLKEKNINDSENETTKDEETGGRLPVPELRELGVRSIQVIGEQNSNPTIPTATNSMHSPIFIS